MLDFPPDGQGATLSGVVSSAEGDSSRDWIFNDRVAAKYWVFVGQGKWQRDIGYFLCRIVNLLRDTFMFLLLVVKDLLLPNFNRDIVIKKRPELFLCRREIPLWIRFLTTG